MLNFYDLKEDLNKQLENCDEFFRKEENRFLVFMYLLYVCEKRLGNKKYNFKIEPKPKGCITIDIISRRKLFDKPIVITKQKIKRHAKLYELPE